ncbi:MAG: hypothetical protein ABIP46_01715 [Polaromonas sp.]
MNRQQQIDSFLRDAHLLALVRLREHPERIGEVQAQLGRWRAQSGSTRSDPYLDAWEALLRQPVDALEQGVCADTDAAAALRNVSPMSVLITQRERTGLLQKARNL